MYVCAFVLTRQRSRAGSRRLYFPSAMRKPTRSSAPNYSVEPHAHLSTCSGAPGSGIRQGVGRDRVRKGFECGEGGQAVRSCAEGKVSSPI